jgi:hypothetical protein
MTYTCSVRRRRGGAWLFDRQAWRLAGDEDGWIQRAWKRRGIGPRCCCGGGGNLRLAHVGWLGVCRIVYYVFHTDHLGWVACAEANSTIRLIIAQNVDVLMSDCSHSKDL